MVKLVNGTWRTDFRTPSGKRIRVTIDASDKREAIKLESKMREEYEDAEKVKQKEGLTLGEAFKHSLRVREAWRSAKSLHSIHQVYGMVEKHFGKDCPLSELDDECLLEYGEELHDEGLTPSTINKRFSIIAVLFDEAIQWRKYQGRKPNTVRYKVNNGRKRLISPEEAARVISYFQSSSSEYEQTMADLVITLADTGMRLSEALGVDPRNIHPEYMAVRILDTKNGEDRVIPLTDRALQALTRRTEAPIFYPLTPSTISHIWRRMRKRLGLEHEREFVLHAFRHTFGSTLADSGMDAFRIQKVMGHKAIVTTQRYVKVAAASLTGIAEVMQKKYVQNSVQEGSKGGVLAVGTLGELLEKSRGYPVHTRTVNPQVPGSSPGRGANIHEETTSYTDNPQGVPPKCPK